MHKYTYRINFLIIISFLILNNCTKEFNNNPPQISWINESGYTSSDKTVGIGGAVMFGINVKAGDSPITNLVIKINTSLGEETVLDSGLYSSNFKFSKTIHYGGSNYENWTFTVYDKEGKRASCSIILNKDSNSVYGLINYFSNINIGMQQSLMFGNMIELIDASTYFADSAIEHQNDIYLVSYLGDLLSPQTGITLSSPSDNDVQIFYPQISNWTLLKNEVRYKMDSISISTNDFDNIFNDSLLIASYSSGTAGKRKFKNAKENYVIPFEVTIGALTSKKGLIKINHIEESTNGFVNIDIKIQK